MTTDEPPEVDESAAGECEDGGSARGRLGAEADRAIEELDERIVDLLAWLLDTETRARIYIHLRQSPGSTSDEVAEGTGLYPSTVRESLAELHGEGILDREKRENEGAGNNPYEYTAIPPSTLVGDVVSQLQDQLNTICNLDRHLEHRDGGDDPIRIEVRDEDR